MVGDRQAWFQTDEAWDFLTKEEARNLHRVDVRREAKGLRFITSAEKIKAFQQSRPGDFRPFTLFGSGDFHHLTAVWTQQFTEPFSIVSFDNHPDWDIRPPYWSCGAWVNRALENPLVESVRVWGCGSFECNLPGRLLGNRRAAREGRLRVHPWRRTGKSYPEWLHPIEPDSWRARFENELESLLTQRIYVTVDLDCLAEGEIYTNWEQGRFAVADLIWALGRLHEEVGVIGGDLCGAWSPAKYETGFQRLAGWFDHPRVSVPDSIKLARRQRAVFERVWPALTGL